VFGGGLRWSCGSARGGSQAGPHRAEAKGAPKRANDRARPRPRGPGPATPGPRPAPSRPLRAPRPAPRARPPHVAADCLHILHNAAAAEAVAARGPDLSLPRVVAQRAGAVVVAGRAWRGAGRGREGRRARRRARRRRGLGEFSAAAREGMQGGLRRRRPHPAGGRTGGGRQRSREPGRLPARALRGRPPARRGTRGAGALAPLLALAAPPPPPP
jgi:hypothetical protein